MTTAQRVWAIATMGVALGIALTAGCDSNMGRASGLVAGGTGVHGFDTPEEILSNAYVDRLVQELDQAGFDLNLSRAIDPPVISGRYSMAGEHVYPEEGTLAPGMWIWSNQRSDNRIDTDYEQISGQAGVSTLGEIIRGEGNRFTVYSVFRVTDGGCEEIAVAIVDGMQDSTGNVSAVYLVTPIEQSHCHVPTAGLLDLTLAGASRVIPAALDGASLLAGIE